MNDAAKRKRLTYMINYNASPLTILGAIIGMLQASDTADERRLGDGLCAYIEAFRPTESKKIVRHRRLNLFDIFAQIADERERRVPK